jgi:hypothetical protein
MLRAGMAVCLRAPVNSTFGVIETVQLCPRANKFSGLRLAPPLGHGREAGGSGCQGERAMFTFPVAPLVTP